MSETRLYLSDSLRSASRAGGAAPALDYVPGYLDRFRYLCTIGHAHLPTVEGQVISLFLRTGFLVSDDDTRFPNIGIDCLLHPPAPPRNVDVGRLTDIDEAGLSDERDARDPECSLIRVAATPKLIQNEPSYAVALYSTSPNMRCAMPPGWNAWARFDQGPDSSLGTGFLVEEFEQSGITIGDVTAVLDNEGFAVFLDRKAALDEMTENLDDQEYPPGEEPDPTTAMR